MQRSLTVLSLFYRAQGRFSRRRLLRRTESGQSNIWKAPRRGLSTAGLSEAQWNFESAPPTDGRWRNDGAYRRRRGFPDGCGYRSDESPARPAGDDVKALDETVLARVPDRGNKVQAPEPLKPTNRFGLARRIAQAFHRNPRADRGLCESP